MKPEDTFKPEARNINETLRTLQRVQTLPTMHGKTIIPFTSIMLVLLTKAITAFEITLESWHTSKTVDAKNNSKRLLDNTLFSCNIPFSLVHFVFPIQVM